eukprot:CAMPEP_0175288740 /NCGR_PEP_ID=MMETSP0093-20121207/54970_1 /TAXON_ID=311494 /ORGANISM="Alexandrium monilatum, Strain CCMP3105" /LENGTH=176 /DNA_ID=CAMNT_0016584317 /DNA_START=135 /DNA_END=662 /DNA_ORIENTATION=+
MEWCCNYLLIIELFCDCRNWKTVVASDSRSAFLSGCHSKSKRFISFLRLASGKRSNMRNSSSTLEMMASLSGGGLRHVSSASPMGLSPSTPRALERRLRLGSPRTSSAPYNASESTCSVRAHASKSAFNCRVRTGAARPRPRNTWQASKPARSWQRGSPCANTNSAAKRTLSTEGG